MLVDDNPEIIQQTRRLLQPEFDVVEALSDGSGLLPAVAAHEPDIVVLDISLPGENGIDLAAKLKKSGCEAGIIFLTVHTDADYAHAALAAGGSGYIVKARLASDLMEGVKAVLQGKRFVSPCPELHEFQ